MQSVNVRHDLHGKQTGLKLAAPINYFLSDRRLHNNGNCKNLLRKELLMCRFSSINFRNNLLGCRESLENKEVYHAKNIKTCNEMTLTCIFVWHWSHSVSSVLVAVRRASMLSYCPRKSYFWAICPSFWRKIENVLYFIQCLVLESYFWMIKSPLMPCVRALSPVCGPRTDFP